MNKASSLIFLAFACSFVAGTSCIAYGNFMKGLRKFQSEQLTIDDMVTAVAQRFAKISGDLAVAGHIAKKLSVRLLHYVQENPVDASLIAGGALCMYLVASKLIRAMTATRCPACYRNHHEVCDCGDCY